MARMSSPAALAEAREEAAREKAAALAGSDRLLSNAAAELRVAAKARRDADRQKIATLIATLQKAQDDADDAMSARLTNARALAARQRLRNEEIVRAMTRGSDATATETSESGSAQSDIASPTSP